MKKRFFLILFSLAAGASFLIGCASYEPAKTHIEPVSDNPQQALRSKLMIFGGDDHKTYLGCLNCNDLALDSIFNRYGPHGSRFASESIWNRFGVYGSRFSNNSPWSRYATEPPVIVDGDGKFYGRFTVNRFHSERTRIPEFLKLIEALAAQVESQ